MKSFIIGTIALIFLGIILVFGVTIYMLQKHPQRITHELMLIISQQIKDTTLSAESIGIHIFPFPKIYLTNVVLKQSKNNKLYIERCLLTPNFKKLLSGTFTVSSIQLIQPTILFNFVSHQSKDDLHQKSFSLNQLLNLFNQLSGIKISIEDGNVTLQQNNKCLLTILGVNSKLHISNNLVANLDINFNAIECNTSISEQKNSYISIKKSQVTIDNVNLSKKSFLDTTDFDIQTLLKIIEHADIKLSTVFSINNTVKDIHLVYTTSIKKSPEHETTLHGQINIEGKVYNEDYSAPILVYIPFSTEPSENSSQLPNIVYKNAILMIDKNKIHLHGVITNYNRLATISIDGDAKVKNISLPYLFSFARQLPMGIQHALDQLSGDMKFVLTTTQLNIPQITIHSLGTNLEGSGGIASFSKPTIALNLTTKQLNINTLIPELDGKKSIQKQYPLSPIFGSSQETDASQPTISIGYDINIHAMNAQLWKFDGKQFLFTIYPESSGVQLKASYKNFYDGIVTSSLLISEDYNLLLSLENIQIKKPLSLITKKYSSEGIINGTTKIQSKGETVEEFLTNLKGTLDLYVKDGFFKSQQNKPVPFSAIHISCDNVGQQMQKNLGRSPSHYITYDGNWNIAITSPEWKASIAMAGPILFSKTHGLPLKGEKIPSKTSISGFGLQSITYGDISFDVTQPTISFSNFKGTLDPETTFSGTIKAITENTDATIWEGNLNITTHALKKILSCLDYQCKNISSDRLNNLDIQGEFYISPTTTRLSNVHGTLDNTTFNFSLNGLSTDPPVWTGDIQLGTLNLDTYFLTTQTNTLSTQQKPWDTKLLHLVNIKGTIAIHELTYLTLPYTNVLLPIDLNQGLLSIYPITASLCDGKTEASLKAKALASNKAQIDVHYTSSNVDMLTLSKKRKKQYLIAGMGGIDLTTQTIATSSEDIIKNLNGKWILSIQHGYFKEKTSKNKRYFSNIGATGTITNGIITNKDFALMGPSLSVKGTGIVDLPKWDLDYMLTIHINGMPTTIPIQYYGSLDNPQHKINAASVIIGTIGSIGSDTLGVIEDIFLTPLKLLTP